MIIAAHAANCACPQCKPTPAALSDKAAAVFRGLAELHETERGRILGEFCQCGSADLRCQCWNDE